LGRLARRLALIFARVAALCGCPLRFLVVFAVVLALVVAVVLAFTDIGGQPSGVAVLAQPLALGLRLGCAQTAKPWTVARH
jgi:hypothetical protein